MLEHVQISNWKAYSDGAVYFSEGLNLFVGPNGSGKTTILDAISLALTGSISSGDFKALVRDPKLESSITLGLTLFGNRASISRTFTRERITGGELSISDSTPRSLSWEALNREIAEHLRIDPIFFARIIYMAEGEVFEYARNPPSEAIDNAVQNAFGIEHLRLLADEIQSMQKSFERSSQSLRVDLTKAPPVSTQPGQDIGSVRADFERHTTQLSEAQRHYATLKPRFERHQLRLTELRRIENEISFLAKDAESLGFHFGSSRGIDADIRDLASRAIEKIQEMERSSQSLSVELGELKNREKYFVGILQLLESVSQGDKQEGAPCPVCRRPIDGALGAHLMGDTQAALNSVRNALKKMEAELVSARAELQRTRATSQRLQSLSSQIPRVTVTDESDGVQIELTNFGETVRNEEAKVRDLELELSALNNSMKSFAQEVESDKLLIARLEGASGAADMQQAVRERLVESYKGVILSSAIHKALLDSVRNLRDIGLSPFYQALGQLWVKCRPEHDGEIVFDSTGKLSIRLGSKQLGFSQLSGGEKTVLLILARVLMCAMFSSVDFMMIDEPLEHLDSRNRRSVLNFLVAATRGGLIKQAIVTTFEESLVRKYLDRDLAKITYLMPVGT